MAGQIAPGAAKMLSISLEFNQDVSPRDNFTRSRFRAASIEEWDNAADLNSLAKWLGDSGHEEFLMPVGQG